MSIDQEGNLTNIIADKGIYNAVSRQLTLMENVVVQKTKDNRLSTPNSSTTMMRNGPSNVQVDTD